MNTPNADFIDSIDSSEFDTEAMRIDDRNKNFSPDQLEEYRHENIVMASFANGQFSQARQQCSTYGFNYEVMRERFNTGGAL